LSRQRKVAIVGPESTGKSELSQQLAHHYKSDWVPEYAREYLHRLGRPYEEKDLLEIARGQLRLEDEKREADPLFCDTNLIVIKIWSDHKYGQTHPEILKSLEQRTYDFYLLTDIDLPWQEDPQREHPKLRAYFFGLYEQYLRDHQLPYGVVSGVGKDRLTCAINALQGYFMTI